MPKLYSVATNFDYKSPLVAPSHYFPSASFERDKFGRPTWSFDIDADFPVQCYIHSDHTPSRNEFWIALRKDVERRYNGDCFYLYKNMNYRYWWNKDAQQEYMREYSTQTHGYWSFYFEEESDSIMFILQHAELLSKKRYRFHPNVGANCKDRRYDVPDDEEILGAYKI